MTERQLQDAVVAAARYLGYLVFHPYDSRRSEPGWPDLAIVGQGRLIFAELKTAKGAVKPAQRLWLDALTEVASQGLSTVEVHLWRPADWTSGRVEEVLRAN